MTRWAGTATIRYDGISWVRGPNAIQQIRGVEQIELIPGRSSCAGCHIDEHPPEAIFTVERSINRANTFEKVPLPFPAIREFHGTIEFYGAICGTLRDEVPFPIVLEDKGITQMIRFLQDGHWLAALPFSVKYDYRDMPSCIFVDILLNKYTVPPFEFDRVGIRLKAVLSRNKSMVGPE